MGNDEFIAKFGIRIYFDTENGNDDNPGTGFLPVRTFERALQLIPDARKKSCKIIQLNGFRGFDDWLGAKSLSWEQFVKLSESYKK